MQKDLRPEKLFTATKKWKYRDNIDKNTTGQSISNSLSQFPFYINGNDTWNDGVTELME